MSENNTKRRPDFIAHAVVPGTQNTPGQFIRIGVGFTLKNGGVSLLTDAQALSGHVVLVGIDAELPPLDGFKHGPAAKGADFIASMVRDAGNESYWTDIGTAYRQEGYVSVHVAVWPNAGKIILSVPKAR